MLSWIARALLQPEGEEGFSGDASDTALHKWELADQQSTVLVRAVDRVTGNRVNDWCRFRCPKDAPLCDDGGG
jgi:hypothetical protein